MGKRNGLSRGDARRNARLIRLRGVVRHDRAILAIDLADTKQALALCDHDSRVLARRSVRGHAWQLEEALRWGRGVAVQHGFAGIVVGCEPTGHRWRIVAELCDRLGMDLVCVQPLLVARAREGEDLTGAKSDPKDAVVIARLVGELRCYLPERADQIWARLRQLGARRVQLTTTAGACRQQLRDLLECAWPAVLDTAAKPLDSVTFRAAVSVVLARDQGDPAGGERQRPPGPEQPGDRRGQEAEQEDAEREQRQAHQRRAQPVPVDAHHRRDHQPQELQPEGHREGRQRQLGQRGRRGPRQGEGSGRHPGKRKRPTARGPTLLAGTFSGRLVRVNRNGSRTVLASEGLFAPGGFAIAHDGSIYVTDNGILAGAGQVLRIPPR